MSLVFAALLLATPVALAPQGGDPVGDSVPAVKAKKVKKVCRTVVRPGSHISDTVCRTPEEWQATADSASDEGNLPVMPGDRTATGRAVGYRCPLCGRDKPGP